MLCPLRRLFIVGCRRARNAGQDGTERFTLCRAPSFRARLPGRVRGSPPCAFPGIGRSARQPATGGERAFRVCRLVLRPGDSGRLQPRLPGRDNRRNAGGGLRARPGNRPLAAFRAAVAVAGGARCAERRLRATRTGCSAYLAGMPPLAWVRRRRLDEAQRQLRAGLPLDKVALHVGYASASALCFALRRERGVGARGLRASPDPVRASFDN